MSDRYVSLTDEMSGHSTSKLQQAGGHTTTVTPLRTTLNTTSQQAKTGRKGEVVVFWGYMALFMLRKTMNMSLFIHYDEKQKMKGSGLECNGVSYKGGRRGKKWSGERERTGSTQAN